MPTGFSSFTDAIDRSPLSSFQKRTIAFCFAIGLLDGLDALTFGNLVPAISKDWGVGAGSLSLSITAGLVGMIVGGMAFGPVADRSGRRIMVMAGILVFGVTTIGLAMVQSLEMLVLLRFIAGLGLGVVGPTVISIASEFAPTRSKATVVMLITSSLAVGGFLGGLVAGLIIPAFGWRSVFLLGGIVPLILFVFTFRLLPESIGFLAATGRTERALAMLARMKIEADFVPTPAEPSPATTKSKTPVVELFREGRAVGTILLWIVYFCGLLFTYFVFSWMPTLLSAAGIEQQVAIFATSLATLGCVIGQVALGVLVDRRNKDYRVLVVAFGIGAVLFALLTGVVANLWLMLLVVFLIGFTAIGSQAAVNTVTSAMYPVSARSTGLGWAYGLGRLGSVAGPALGGMLISAGVNATKIFLMLVVPALLAAAALAGVPRSLRRAGARQEAPASPGSVHERDLTYEE